jgi:hypothetical protein
MKAVDKYDHKWKHLLNGIGFCSSRPPTPNQVFEKHLVSYNVLRGTGMQSLPRKPTARPSMGGGNIGDNKESNFLQGEPSKIKDHDLQKLFDLYSAGIFSCISF